MGLYYIRHCRLEMWLWKFCPSGHSSSGSAWIHSKISQRGQNNQTTQKHLKPLLQLSAVHLYAHYILNSYTVTVLNSWLCSRRSLYCFETYLQTWKLTYLFGKLLYCRYSSNLYCYLSGIERVRIWYSKIVFFLFGVPLFKGSLFLSLCSKSATWQTMCVAHYAVIFIQFVLSLCSVFIFINRNQKFLLQKHLKIQAYLLCLWQFGEESI